MVRTSFAAALSALVLFACVEAAPSAPAATPVAPPATAPTTVVAPSTPPVDPPTPGPAPVTIAPTDAGAVALGASDASAVTPDDAVDPQFLACTADSDCVSVERVGCCHNGRMVGVAASKKDAYLKSFTCPEKHPKCPMYRIKQDDRVGACNAATHLCGLK